MLGGEKSRLHSKPSAQVILLSVSWETGRTSARGLSSACSKLRASNLRSTNNRQRARWLGLARSTVPRWHMCLHGYRASGQKKWTRLFCTPRLHVVFGNSFSTLTNLLSKSGVSIARTADSRAARGRHCDCSSLRVGRVRPRFCFDLVNGRASRLLGRL